MPIALPTPTAGLPNDPVFKQFHHNAKISQNVLIHDPTHGKDANTAQFLRDIVGFRKEILSQLPSDHVDQGKLKTPGAYIGILAPLSYDFVVALYAVIALGAAAVPMAINLLPEEGTWLLNKCDAICLLTHKEYIPLASQMQSQRLPSVPSPMVPIEYPHSESKSLPEIDETLEFPLTQPGLLLFTSGTTGAPKGVMIPRQIFSPNVTPDCEASDVAIAYRAVNGLPCILNLIDTVYVGARTEIFTTGLQPGPIWQRLRGGDVTVLAGAPRFWQVLVEYYDENLRNLPEAERQLYDEGARNLRVVWFGGGMPLPAAKRFWLRMREKEWTVKYGSSELGREAMVFRFSTEEESLKPVIGRPLPGTEVKLTEGDKGELLVKNSTMLIGYIGDEERTRAAFDKDGFYRTGDLMHRDSQGLYVFDGRASADFVRFGALHVSIYEVESHLCDLPYILEAYVLSVPDTHHSWRVGALVVLNGDSNVTLAELRKDLCPSLAKFKLPTLLRVVGKDEKLPRSPEGKLSRKPALEKFFPAESESSADVQVWDLGAEDLSSQKAWDWGGV